MRKFIANIQAKLAIYSGRKKLAELDEHELKDLGLTKTEVKDELEKGHSLPKNREEMINE